ncbi:3D domain-containing protein [Clostridium sp. KNHs214]|uniref:3D domain-containing protein n=1 Tax=Clostridium sp. KNHs214 TaxID=1540257 RepID=UPI00054D9E5B|nr:3D domain-containing protein [Clostridium sp. KNHs214]
MKQKARDLSNKSFAKGPVAVLVVILLFIGVTLGIATIKKTVSVVIDGKEQKIVTYRSDLKRILADNNIRIENKDKINVSLGSEVKDGDKIQIKKAVKVKVDVDGKTLSIVTAEDTVEDMLDEEGIKVKKEDAVKPSMDDKITNGMNISITRVTSKLVKENQALDFTTVVKKDNNLEEGKKKVIQAGQKGEKIIATRVVYEDGKEVSRRVVSESVTKKPVQQMVAVGTMGVVRPSRGGGSSNSSLNFRKVIRMKATAYTASEACTGKGSGDPYQGITATGTRAIRNPSGYSTIAVDPRVIPLGTKVYVEGYGLAIAEDVGGAIKGNIIDVFLNTNSQANSWGVRWVNVYILK